MLRVPDKIDFAVEEEKINKIWQDSYVFRNSLKQSVTNKKYSFFDGPPFATGLPHYGHVLAGTVKDIVTRFAHQSGHHVGRRFGWDCHGLPIEFEIDKALGITGPQDVEKMGIANYNAECRKIVMRYSHEWEMIMGRLARWIDFENDYKTMYPWFMESIWFIFRELYVKGLVYKGVKVMPYSTACSTPLSNFESGQNYKDVVDPQVTVGFPLETEPDVLLVAWTTTPWTLPSNLSVCVNPTLIYVRIQSMKTKKVYILLESRLIAVFKKLDDYKILKKFPGEELRGLHYKPLFPYFLKMKEKGAFRVLVDTYVTDDAGTGIVHQAPYFGEDDYRVCLAAGIITKEQNVICPIDAAGRFVDPVTDFKGLHVKDADKEIIKYIKQKEPHRLIEASTIKHSYPFCWRSETPLIYRAVPSWFIRVEPLVDSLLRSNQSTYWVPDFVKEKRFGNWLRGARDWAVSRNRFWGTPIPIWQSEDCLETICIGSIAELEELSGQKIKDLHRESIDDITIPSVRPGMPPLRRVAEVFDCWFESGSMPYAQLHFPFTRDIEINFHDSFPADFIAEGIDQTRGWFYTLLVISTALFNKAPFQNLIANGLVLASDGQKMSKRKKNYPDPLEVVHRYGADALRLYLINSPVVRAENLRFTEQGVKDVLKDVMLPWYNAYRYLAQSLERLQIEENVNMEFGIVSLPVENTMDKWIKSATQTLVTTVWHEMKQYHLYKVVRVLVDFIDQLTNWYIRMNRKRLKGDSGVKQCKEALSTLFEVLWTFVRVMAPFTPYISELMFRNLKRQLGATAEGAALDSIHYLPLPLPVSVDIDLVIERRVRAMQYVISAGRVIRDKRTVPMKHPLPKLIVIHKDQDYLDDLKAVENYILEELNIKDLILSNECEKYGVSLAAQVDHKVLGARLKGDFRAVLSAVQGLTDVQVQTFLRNKQIEVLGHTLSLDDVFISYRFADGSYNAELFEGQGSQEVALLLDMQRDASMFDEGLAREVVNVVQKLRKKGKLLPTDPITVLYSVIPPEADLASAIVCHKDYIESSLRVPLRPAATRKANASTIVKEVCQLKGSSAEIELDIVKDFVSDWGGVRLQTVDESQICKNSVGAQRESPSKVGVAKASPVAKEQEKKASPTPKIDSKQQKNKAEKRNFEATPKAVANKSSLRPCVRYVIVKTCGLQPVKDPFGGIIIPIENPTNEGNFSCSQLKKQACDHFGLKAEQVKLTLGGAQLPDADSKLPSNISGQTLFISSPKEVITANSDGVIPNQPFANVEYEGKLGLLFLTSGDGKLLTANEILQAATDLFQIRNKKVALMRAPNAPSNSILLQVTK